MEKNQFDPEFFLLRFFFNDEGFEPRNTAYKVDTYDILLLLRCMQKSVKAIKR